MAAFNYIQVVHSNRYSELQPWGYVPLVICSLRQEEEEFKGWVIIEVAMCHAVSVCTLQLGRTFAFLVQCHCQPCC